MIVDFFFFFNEEMLVYFGDLEIKVCLWVFIDIDGYYMNVIKMGEYLGMYVDVLVYFVFGGKIVDEFLFDKFIGKVFVIDVCGGEGFVRFEEIFDFGYYGKIVLFFIGGREFFLEVVFFFVVEGVKVVGIDYMMIGDEMIYIIFFLEEILIFENLVNFEEVFGREFMFIVFLLKIEGGLGSLVRVVVIFG